MKISLITLHRVFNFGSFLQTYALQEYLTGLGHEVEVIDYKPKQISNLNYFWDYDHRQKKNIFQALFYNAAVFPKRFIRKRVFDQSIARHVNVSKRQYRSFEEIKQAVPDADLYITGSDQVWNSEYNRGVDPAFFLAYAPTGKKRVAYAASFGRTKIEPCEQASMQSLLEQYEAVSVRENSALPILQELGRNDAIQVLDPTFLLDHEAWKAFMAPPLVKERYLLIYQLNKNPFMIETAVRIAQEKNIKVVKLSLNKRKLPGVDFVFNNITPSQFLALFSGADFVVTDSFHGGAFSINFEKDFAVVPPDRYATRLVSLLETMGVAERLVAGEFQLKEILAPLPRQRVLACLAAERQKSCGFLNRFLS